MTHEVHHEQDTTEPSTPGGPRRSLREGISHSECQEPMSITPTRRGGPIRTQAISPSGEDAVRFGKEVSGGSRLSPQPCRAG